MKRTILRYTTFSIVLAQLCSCSMLGDYNPMDLLSGSNPLSTVSSPDLTTSRIQGAMKLAEAATLSNEEVIQYAKSFSKMKDAQHEVASSSNPYTFRLEGLVAKHLKEDGLNLNFKVYLSPEVNAFAMADGTVRIYSGLMDRMKNDELLFVIGHEIGHVKHEHSKAQLQKAYATNAALTAGAGELNSFADHGTASGVLTKIGVDQASGILEDLANAQFSQGDEYDADDYGFQFLKKHGIPADAGVRALKKLAALAEEDSNFVQGIFSSHPNAERRAMRLHEKLSEGSGAEEIEVVEIQEGEAPQQELALAQQEKMTVEQPQSLGIEWAAQVLAASTIEEAQSNLEQFEELGFEGRIMTVEVRGKLYHRVLIGSFDSIEEARAALAPIAETGFCDGEPFAQKIEQ